MTSDDGLAYSIAVSIASIAKALVVPPTTDLMMVVSLTVACLNACSVCECFNTH